VKCLNARDACRGWELNVARISKARTGTFFADFINFKRRTETTGWRFNALLLMVNDVEVNTNPLGPFQDMGQAVFTI
jgi:predicted SprT family Zn-dependent metalloprotease